MLLLRSDGVGHIYRNTRARHLKALEWHTAIHVNVKLPDVFVTPDLVQLIGCAHAPSSGITRDRTQKVLVQRRWPRTAEK